MRYRNGFALMELLIALTVAAVLLFGGRVLLVQSTDTTVRLGTSAEEIMSVANGERMIRWLLLQLDTAGVVFQGDGHNTHFQSRCDTPYGWTERCSVHLSLSDTPSGRFLTVITGGRESAIATTLPADALTYMLAAEDGGVWVREWSFQLTLPHAVGLVQSSDTSILRVGMSR